MTKENFKSLRTELFTDYNLLGWEGNGEGMGNLLASTDIFSVTGRKRNIMTLCLQHNDIIYITKSYNNQLGFKNSFNLSPFPTMKTHRSPNFTFFSNFEITFIFECQYLKKAIYLGKQRFDSVNLHPKYCQHNIKKKHKSLSTALELIFSL